MLMTGAAMIMMKMAITMVLVVMITEIMILMRRTLLRMVNDLEEDSYGENAGGSR